LRVGGVSIFRYLEAGGAIIASVPNVTAFQTFCHLSIRSVPSPDKAFFSSNPRVFPHAVVEGPGLVMLSALFHDEKIYPLMLDEFPHLYIRPEVFFAASDPHVGFRAERMLRQGCKGPKGAIVIGVTGLGILFIKLAGITRFQVLRAAETIYLSSATLAGYQSSCKAVEEQLPAPPAKEFKDVKITGPGLVIMQGSNTKGRPLPHLAGGGTSLAPPTKRELKALLKAHKMHKDEEHAAGVRRGSATPAKPLVGNELIKSTEEHRQMLMDSMPALQDIDADETRDIQIKLVTSSTKSALVPASARE